MSKQDYELLAGILGETLKTGDAATVDSITSKLMYALSVDNPRFNAEIFRNAITQHAGSDSR